MKQDTARSFCQGCGSNRAGRPGICEPLYSPGSATIRMDGWARLSSVDKPECAERALKLLERMKGLAHEGMGPNERTYTSALTALVKSGSWEACERARQLLAEMEVTYESGNALFRPTTSHYNTVFNLSMIKA
jgi:hypothetical protein